MVDDKEDLLFSGDDNSFDSLSHSEAIELLKHLRKQFKVRYRYLLGEWRNSHRAKDTANGKFVGKEEIVKYMSE